MVIVRLGVGVIQQLNKQNGILVHSEYEGI